MTDAQNSGVISLPVMDAMIGEVVDSYEIVELLNDKGAMGSVFLARHPITNREAVIKVLRAEFSKDKTQVDRFLQEAKAANAIRHPNIIDIISAGFTPASGRPYLLMEYLKGSTLTDRICNADRGRLTEAETVRLGLQITAPLARAHEAGIVHRDLKPDNLFVVADPPSPGHEIKILDFGIAKLRTDIFKGSIKTVVGLIAGSPAYMSPEQWQAGSAIDKRTDIYSLGLVLYEMLCGTRPFDTEDIGELRNSHMTLLPPGPRTRNQDISEAMERVILRALEKIPDNRFQSMEEMGSALDFKPRRSTKVTIFERKRRSDPAPGPLKPKSPLGNPHSESLTSRPPWRSRRLSMMVGFAAILVVAMFILVQKRLRAVDDGSQPSPDGSTSTAPAEKTPTLDHKLAAPADARGSDTPRFKDDAGTAPIHKKVRRHRDDSDFDPPFRAR